MKRGGSFLFGIERGAGVLSRGGGVVHNGARRVLRGGMGWGLG